MAFNLARTIDNGQFDSPQRIGCFSYGSGCCSEFFSGVAIRESQEHQRRFDIGNRLSHRHELSIADYDALLRGNSAVRFGTRNVTLDPEFVPEARVSGRGMERLFLKAIREYHREYVWVT